MTAISCATVLFVALPARDSTGTIGWHTDPAGLAHVTRHPDDWKPPADHVVGIWRLLASNHRELARSAAVYDSFESAYSTVLRWQSMREKFDVSTFHGERSGMHGWSVSIEGSIAFTAARWYETGTLSLESCSASIDAFCLARVSELPWSAVAVRRSSAARAAVSAW